MAPSLSWSTRGLGLLLAVLASTVSGPIPATAEAAKPARNAAAKPGKPAITMDIFLDRLMVAESGGRDNAKNPRSTATGPFQFIVSTFLSVTQRHFPKEVEKLSTAQILALRTNREFARKAAAAFTRDNAAVIAAAGHKPTFPNLRLAFLLGASGANKILSAPRKARLVNLMSRGVIQANPFMARMTAGDLIRRAAADIRTNPATTAGIKPGKLPAGYKPKPRIRVRCNLSLPSCRRWLALQKRKLANKRRGRRTRVSKR